MRFLKIGVVLVIFAFMLALYGSLVLHYAGGGRRLPLLREPILEISNFPKTVRSVFTSLQFTGVHETFLRKDSNFKEINNLDYDVFGLAPFWNSDIWEIRLFNFRNDSVLHKWEISNMDGIFNPDDLIYSNSVPTHPVLYKNKEVITQLSNSPNLIKLDSNSNIVWINHDVVFHHSLNLDADSNVWVCAYNRDENYNWNKNNYFKNPDGTVIGYEDDYLVQIDSETGKMLYHKSIGEILVENNYEGLLLGGQLYDAIHLNDIQPVLEDGLHWKRGDLFVSIRNRNAVLHYRPSTNKLLRVISGPFLKQHDVDVISSDEISIFNNNAIFAHQYTSAGTNDSDLSTDIQSSDVVRYNYPLDSFYYPHRSYFIKENIYTGTEGLSETLSNGDIYIESQNNGKMYISRENETIWSGYFEASKEGYIQTPCWVRIYETLNF